MSEHELNQAREILRNTHWQINRPIEDGDEDGFPFGPFVSPIEMDNGKL